MAKQTKQKSIEETLWDSANKLRGSVESSEYKHVVLGLIFLKKAAILIMTFDLPKQSNFERRNLPFKDLYTYYNYSTACPGGDGGRGDASTLTPTHMDTRPTGQ